jgi:hypothetical protein
MSVTSSTETAGALEGSGKEVMDVRRETDTEAEPIRSNGRVNLRRASVVCVAGLLVGLYLSYVVHFWTNEPLGDEWLVLQTVHAALHGHLTLSLLWTQHLESRIFFPNLLFVASGFLDRYDVRSVLLVSALMYVAAYFVLLKLYRFYADRPLTAVPTAVLGLIWFSVADMRNALWGFQIGWIIIIFCCILVIYFLTVSTLNRGLALALALTAAVIASFSDAQGFLLFPVALFLILWNTPWNRRTYLESGITLLTGGLSAAVFLIGYNWVLPVALCPVATRCKTAYLVAHPAQVVSFTLQLIGNVFPTASPQSVPHEVIGAVVAATAIFVLVQSIRKRTGMLGPPVPAALIVFAFLFDILIVDGRFGYGQPDSTYQYALPQLMLLTAIAIYLLPKILDVFHTPSTTTGSRALQVLCLLALVPLAIEVIGTTNFGIAQGRDFQANAVSQGRLVVNYKRIPENEQACYFSNLLAGGILNGNETKRLDVPIIREAQQDKLSMFIPDTRDRYRAEGPPYLPGCTPSDVGKPSARSG